MNIAENIYRGNGFCECRYGSLDDCKKCDLMPWPPAYHTFLSLVYMIFGPSNNIAIVANIIIGSLTSVLFFLISFLIFKNSSLSLIGALVFSFIPAGLKFSGTAALDVFSMFLILISFCSYLIYLKHSSKWTMCLMLLSLVLSAYARPEYFVYSSLMMALVLFHKKNSLAKRVLLASSFIVLLLPLIAQLYYDVFVMQPPGYYEPLVSRISSSVYSLPDNIIFFLHPRYNSLFFAVIAILGFVSLRKSSPRRFSLYIIFFLIFVLIYSSFHEGDFLYNLDASRYSLILYLPLSLAFLSGFDYIKKLSKGSKIIPITVLLFTLAALFPTNNYIYHSSIFKESRDRLLEQSALFLDKTYIISYSTSLIMNIQGLNAISPSDFFYSDVNFSEYSLYLYKDNWWYKNEEYSKRFEEQLNWIYDFELLHRGDDFEIIKLTNK